MRRALELERIARASSPSPVREEATIQIRIGDRYDSARDDDSESGGRSVDVRVFESTGVESGESMVLAESAHKTFENAAHEALECYDLLLEQGHMNEHAYNQTCIQLRNLNQTRDEGTSSARRQMAIEMMLEDPLCVDALPDDVMWHTDMFLRGLLRAAHARRSGGVNRRWVKSVIPLYFHCTFDVQAMRRCAMTFLFEATLYFPEVLKMLMQMNVMDRLFACDNFAATVVTVHPRVIAYPWFSSSRSEDRPCFKQWIVRIARDCARAEDWSDERFSSALVASNSRAVRRANRVTDRGQAREVRE